MQVAGDFSRRCSWRERVYECIRWRAGRLANGGKFSTRNDNTVIRLKYNGPDGSLNPAGENSGRRGQRGRWALRMKFAQEKYATPGDTFEFDVTRERTYTRDRRVHTGLA